MVKITRFGVELDTPYGRMKLRFGRKSRIEVPEKNITTTVRRKKFPALARKVRDGELSEEKIDLLGKISNLRIGWKKSEKAASLLDADTEEEIDDLREEVNSKLEEEQEKREKKQQFRRTWEKVEKKGYHVRKYRGSKLRYLLVCGGYRRTFYVIQLPPEYDFRIYRGKSSKRVTLGRRLEKSPSKLIESYNPGREDDVVQDLQDDKEALENLGKGLNALPEPQKSELKKRLVALRLTGQKR